MNMTLNLTRKKTTALLRSKQNSKILNKNSQQGRFLSLFFPIHTRTLRTMYVLYVSSLQKQRGVSTLVTHSGVLQFLQSFCTKTHYFFFYHSIKWKKKKKCLFLQKHCENSLKPRSGRKCRYAAPLVL
uniref:Uncharacterized protein n=1 Tax=Cacopsylla melanoneura TaxID=428564 RepID=A0A8D8ZE38_9HEMI